MVGEKLFQTNLLSRLSHKVCRLLSSPVLLRKFTSIDIIVDVNSRVTVEFRQLFDFITCTRWNLTLIMHFYRGF